MRVYRRRKSHVYNAQGMFVGNVEYGSICLRGIMLFAWNVYIKDPHLYIPGLHGIILHPGLSNSSSKH
jgi:hypothetical protein